MMFYRLCTSGIITLFALFYLSPLRAQDLHYSQLYNNMITYNPGLTGIFNGDQRLAVSHRNQWSNIVPWQSFTASFDTKFLSRYERNKGSFFSGGILMNYDRSSDLSDLTLANINVLGSYTQQLSQSHLLTLGALVGYASRGFDRQDLDWDNQWNITTFTFDQRLDPVEPLLSDRASYLETAVGINYRWQKDLRTKMDVGFGVYHLVPPGVGYQDVANVPLFRRYSLSGVGHLQMSENSDLVVFGQMQLQGPYREWILGALKKLYLDQRPGHHLELHLGVGHRFDVAWFPVFAVQYNNFYGSISYDMNATGIRALKGIQPNTVEIHIEYKIRYPSWQRECPIY